MDQSQLDLFEAPHSLPNGFRYLPDFLTADEESDLVGRFTTLPFKEFEFRGYRGNRRVLPFGWRYDFNRMELQRTDDMPEFLLQLRERATHFASLEALDLQHALLAEEPLEARHLPAGRAPARRRTSGTRAWRRSPTPP